MKPLRFRRAAMLGVLGSLLLLLGAALLVPQRKVVIDATFYERFTVGMTEAEVDAAAPIPPGDYTGGYVYVTSQPTCEGQLPPYVDYTPHPDGTTTAPHFHMASTASTTWGTFCR